MEVEETHTRRLPGQRETGETRGGQSGTHRGRCQFRNMPTMTSILSSRRKSTKKVQSQSVSILSCSSRPSRQFIPASARYPASLQRNRQESRMKRQAELLALQERTCVPRANPPPLLPPSLPQNLCSNPTQTRTSPTRKVSGFLLRKSFFFFVFLVFPILFRSIILFDRPVSSPADCSRCRWRTFPGDTTSPQPSTVKGERQLLKS